MCGKANSGCSPCSLKECEDEAKAKNSFSFSYRGTGETWCKMCDENEFKDMLPGNTTKFYAWGIYRKGKTMVSFL